MILVIVGLFVIVFLFLVYTRIAVESTKNPDGTYRSWNERDTLFWGILLLALIGVGQYFMPTRPEPDYGFRTLTPWERDKYSPVAFMDWRGQTVALYGSGKRPY
jgi:hypothetical protein